MEIMKSFLTQPSSRVNYLRSLSLTRLLLDVTISGFCVQPTTEEEFRCNKFAENPPELSCESFLVTRIFARREKNMKIYSILLLPISLDGCPFRKPSHSKAFAFLWFHFLRKVFKKTFFLSLFMKLTTRNFLINFQRIQKKSLKRDK